MANSNVVKIYELRTLGYDELFKQLQNIDLKFKSINETKAALNKQKANTDDSEAIKKLNEQIDAENVKTKELILQKKQLVNELKSEQVSRQALINSQSTEKAGTDAQTAANKAQANSYNEIRQQQKELYAQLKNADKTSTVSNISFGGQQINYQQAINEYKRLSAAEQDFRRQFQKDGTLVAEYSSGIVNAFSKLGLGDLIKNNLSRGESELNTLNADFERLKEELNAVRAAGAGGFENIEKSLIANRTQAIELDESLKRVRADLQGAGSIGQQVTAGLQKGFHELKGEVGGFLLTFIGLQQGFQFIEQGVEKFETAERSAIRLEGAIKNLGKEEDFGDLTKNLDQLKEKFQFLSIFDLREATQKLVTYGKLSTDQIKQLTELAVNLTAQQGGTVAENSEILIKALEGNARGLKLYGINIKDAATEQGRFDLITSELTKRIQGQAEAFAKSDSGGIEKYKQKLTELQVAVGQKLFPLLSALASALFFLTDNFSTLATAVGTFTVFMIAANAELIIAKAQILGYNLLIGASRVALYALSIAQTAYNIGLQIYTNVTNLASAATRLFGLSMTALPIGLLLTLIGLLVASFRAFGGAVTGTTAALREQALAQKFAADATAEANKQLAQQRSELDTYVAILKDVNVSESTKLDTLKKVIALNPEYLNGLTLNNIATKEGKEILDAYNVSLQDNAELIAAGTIKNKQFEESTKLRAIRQELTVAQQKNKNGTATGFSDLSPEAQDFITGNGLFNTLAKYTNKAFNEELGADDYVDNLKKLNKKINESDENVIAATNNVTTTQKKLDADRAAYLKAHPVTKESFAIDIPILTEELKQLNDKIAAYQGTQKGLDELIKQRDAAQKKLDELEGKNKKQNNGSKLSGADKDAFEGIDAKQKLLLAQTENYYNEIRKKHQLSFEEEREYNKRIEQINVDALNSKIAYFDKQKSLNLKEKATRADFIKQRSDAELKLIEENKATDNKEFERRKEFLKNELDEEIKFLQDKNDLIQKDPTASATAKAQSQLNTDNQILALQIGYGKEIDALEKKLGQNSLKNAKEAGDAVHSTQKSILDDNVKLTKAALTDAEAAGALSISKFKEQIAEMRLAVATSNASPSSKASANAKIDEQEKTGLLAREVANLQAELPIYKKLYEEKQITAQQYLDFLTNLQQKEADLANNLTGDLEKAKEKIGGIGDYIKNKLGDLFKFNLNTKAGQDAAALFAETVVKTYQVAAQAMDSYYNRQAANIQRSRDNNKKLLDIELQQRKNVAQSQAERDSLDRQYQAKKDEEDRKAFEKSKKIQLAQAKVNLAIQLSNLAVIAFAPNPLNIATLGIAGAISYAIQAALAVATYALNTSNIRAAQYSHGGNIDRSTTRGGQVKGRSHDQGGNPFMFKGRVFEDEVDELNVIRTRNAPAHGMYNISGTHKQIASKLNEIGGGVAFAPGGSITRRFDFGGALGDGLQAPVFTPALSNTLISVGQNDNVLDELKQQGVAIRALAEEQSKRIDRIQVHQVTRSVTDAQKKQVQQQKIGSF